MSGQREDRIVWEGAHVYVYRVSGTRYEVRKHGVLVSTVVGHGSDCAQVVRTAQRLERYPHNIR